MLVVLLAIAGATLTIGACWAGGSIFWRIAKLLTVRGEQLEEFGLKLAVGAALLATTIFGLCAIHVAYPAVFAAIWCGIGLGWSRWGRTGGSGVERASERTGVLGWLGCSILVSYLGIYLVYALAPETASDAVAYHLGLVRQYARAHGFSAITTNIYAFLPMGTEMLFLNAYLIGAHSAAKLVHWALTGATVLLILGFAKRQGYKRAGWVAAVLYVCSPALSLDATSTYNDCALAFFTFGVFAALARWWDKPHDGALIAAGILAGFCFAVKYTGGVAILGAVGAVFVSTLRRTGKPAKVLRDVFVLCAAAAIFMAPWLIKNVLVTGNPVSPFFNAWFPNPYVTEAWEQNYREGFRYFNDFGRAGLIDYATAPLELTVWGSKVTGIVGPVFLLLPAALMGWRSGLVRALGLAAVLAGLPWLANAGARFLIPSLPFAALLIAIGLECLPRRLVSPAALLVMSSHAVLSWPYFVDDWHPAWTWRIEPPIPWEAALRLTPEEEYLAPRIDTYAMARRIDRVAKPGDKVLSLEQLPEAYMDTPVVVCYQSAQGEEMYRALRAPTDRSLWPLDRVSVSFATRVQISGFRVMTTNSDDEAQWAVSEIQLFDGATVLPQSHWQVEADPFPWDAGLVADGDDISTWYSGRRLAPEMMVDVLFGRPIHATKALIIHPGRQQVAQLEYQYRTLDGEWHAAPGEFEGSGNDVDAARLRVWAGRELKSKGITLLLLNTTAEGHNFVTPGIVEDPGAWGFQEVLREGSRILYRVSPSSTE